MPQKKGRPQTRVWGRPEYITRARTVAVEASHPCGPHVDDAVQAHPFGPFPAI